MKKGAYGKFNEGNKCWKKFLGPRYYDNLYRVGLYLINSVLEVIFRCQQFLLHWLEEKWENFDSIEILGTRDLFVHALLTHLKVEKR